MNLNSIIIIFLTFIFHFNVTAQNNAGDISTDVRKYDVDRLSAFKEGFAVISKGNASSVIDNKGELIIPFNTYNFNSKSYTFGQQAEGFVNGYCIVQNPQSGLFGFLNPQGKLAIECQYYGASPFDKEGYALVSDKNQQFYFIDKYNKKIQLDPVFIYTKSLQTTNNLFVGGDLRSIFDPKPQPIVGNHVYNEFSEGLCVGFDKLFGYYDRLGKKQISNQFEYAMPFSEGLAAVAKKNEFGEIKWGFIDKKGKTIIDYKFSYQPGDFHNGLAVVTPTVQNEFQYAFIDQKGDIFYSVKDPKLNETKDFQGSVAFVRNNGNLELLDRSGRLFELDINTNKTNNKGKPIILKSFKFYPNVINENIMVEVSGKMGIIDVKGNVVVSPVFEILSHFDPVSGLAKATFANTQRKIIEGYINSNGVFVIIKESNSKW